MERGRPGDGRDEQATSWGLPSSRPRTETVSVVNQLTGEIEYTRNGARPKSDEVGAKSKVKRTVEPSSRELRPIPERLARRPDLFRHQVQAEVADYSTPTLSLANVRAHEQAMSEGASFHGQTRYHQYSDPGQGNIPAQEGVSKFLHQLKNPVSRTANVVTTKGGQSDIGVIKGCGSSVSAKSRRSSERAEQILLDGFGQISKLLQNVVINTEQLKARLPEPISAPEFKLQPAGHVKRLPVVENQEVELKKLVPERLSIKINDLPRFYGITDKTSALEFLVEMHKIKQTVEADDLTFLKKYVPHALKDAAYTWFTNKSPFKSYSQFEHEFREFFHSRTKVRIALNSLRQIKQKSDESFETFYIRCQPIIGKLQGSSHEEDVVDILVSNSKPSLRMGLISRSHATVSDLYQHATEIDAYMGLDHAFEQVKLSPPIKSSENRQSPSSSFTQCTIHPFGNHSLDRCVQLKQAVEAMKQKNVSFAQLTGLEPKAPPQTLPAAQADNTATGAKPKALNVCSHCSKYGHSENRCWQKYPNLRPLNGRIENGVYRSNSNRSNLNPQAPNFSQVSKNE